MGHFPLVIQTSGSLFIEFYGPSQSQLGAGVVRALRRVVNSLKGCKLEAAEVLMVWFVRFQRNL